MQVASEQIITATTKERNLPCHILWMHIGTYPEYAWRHQKKSKFDFYLQKYFLLQRRSVIGVQDHTVVRTASRNTSSWWKTRLLGLGWFGVQKVLGNWILEALSPGPNLISGAICGLLNYLLQNSFYLSDFSSLPYAYVFFLL